MNAPTMNASAADDPAKLVKALEDALADADASLAKASAEVDTRTAALEKAQANANTAKEKFHETPTDETEAAWTQAQTRIAPAASLLGPVNEKKDAASRRVAGAREALARAKKEMALVAVLEGATVQSFADASADAATRFITSFVAMRAAMKDLVVARAKTNEAASSARSLGANVPDLDVFHLVLPAFSAIDTGALASALHTYEEKGIERTLKAAKPEALPDHLLLAVATIAATSLHSAHHGGARLRAMQEIAAWRFARGEHIAKTVIAGLPEATQKAFAIEHEAQSVVSSASRLRERGRTADEREDLAASADAHIAKLAALTNGSADNDNAPAGKPVGVVARVASLFSGGKAETKTEKS